MWWWWRKRLCETVTNCLAIGSAWETSGVPAMTAALAAAARSRGPSSPSARRAYQVGSVSPAGSRVKWPPTSGSVRGSAISTVSVTSQVSRRQASATSFSQVWSGYSVATARPTGS